MPDTLPLSYHFSRILVSAKEFHEIAEKSFAFLAAFLVFLIAFLLFISRVIVVVSVLQASRLVLHLCFPFLLLFGLSFRGILNHDLSDNLLQFSPIEPYSPTLRTIIDFDFLSNGKSASRYRKLGIS